MKKKKEKFTTVVMAEYFGLEYVTVTFPHCRIHEEYGSLVHAKTMRAADEEVSKSILIGGYPLRGREIHFIRGALSLSLRDLAERLNVSHPTLLSWEKDEEGRPEEHYEAYLRLVFAHEFGIVFNQATLESFVPHPESLAPLEISAKPVKAA